MVEAFIHLSSAVAPEAIWIVKFVAALIALFALYVGIVLAAILLAKEKGIKELYYHVLRELLKIFCRRPRRRRHSKQSRKPR